MIQVLYVSRSMLGSDALELDRLIVQARHNNSMNGITGLLWADGERFAQVIEGDEGAIVELLYKLDQDTRHAGIEIVQRKAIDSPEFGSWSMVRPAVFGAASPYEMRLIHRLESMTTALGDVFRSIIAGPRGATA